MQIGFASALEGITVKVPLVDLKTQYAALQPQMQEALNRVITNTSFILGTEVRQFEEDFAAYCGARHAIGVASGTAALDIALRALGVTAGDEVITTPFTFIATAETIANLGARPVFVDIDPQTYNIDPNRIEAAITSRTKAIMPVHLFGQPAEMDAINEIAHRHRLYVIEDAAQAHGAEYKGQRTGTLGDIACYSFYPSKNLGAYGDGGAVVTDDDGLADKVRLLRHHGSADRYHHVILGLGERLDGMQAAILGVKLPHLDRWNEQRRQAAYRYNALFADSDLITPAESPHVRHVYHCYTVRTPRRDAITEALQAADIGYGIHYPLALHQQPALAYLGYREGDFPVAEACARDIISLPMFPEITAEQQEAVAGTIRRALSRA